jgi:uncharacterized protein YkwD
MSGILRVSLAAVLLLIGFVFGLRISPKAVGLRSLPVPTHITQYSYSGPLAISHLSKSVLGAQAIDPIDFINEINKERSKIGSPQLRLNTTLMRAAKMRVDVIKKYQNFSHQDPHEGIELGTVLPKLQYSFVYASENIGMGGLSAPDFVNGFMNSTSHRNNLLDPKLTETGAAIADGPYQQYYVNYAVQLFAIPGGQNEYLGYKPEEREFYEAELAAVNANLNPLIWVVGKFSRNPRYTDTHYKKLARQKVILETIVSLMRESKPLQNPDVAMILEFNTLL